MSSTQIPASEATLNPAFNLAVALVLADVAVPFDLCARLVADGIDADQISTVAHGLQAVGRGGDWIDAVIESAGYSLPIPAEAEDMAAGTPMEPLIAVVVHLYA